MRSKKSADVDAPRKRGRPPKAVSGALRAQAYSKPKTERLGSEKTSSRPKSRPSRPRYGEAQESEAILEKHQPRIAAKIAPPPSQEIPIPPPPEPSATPAQFRAEVPSDSSADESLRLRKLTLLIAAPPRMVARMFDWKAADLSDAQARSIVDAWDAISPGLLDGLDRVALIKWLAAICATLAPFIENARKPKANESSPDIGKIRLGQDDAGPPV